MPTKHDELRVYEDLDQSFYNIEKLTKGLAQDEEQPRAGYLHWLAERGRLSVRNMHDLSGMSPVEYAQKIEETLDEQAILQMGVDGLRGERAQINHLLKQIQII